jgi:hypothetical protein
MKNLIYIFLLLFLVGCGQEPKKVSILIADDGKEYSVVNKQKLIFENDKMLVITYISEDPSNENIRNEEFQDLYQITADNVNPNSDYDYIALVALEKQVKSFGVTKNSGYRDRRAFKEVLALRKTGT